MKEYKFNEKEIEMAIKDYLDDTIYPYALMITGEWGSGKTYFIKNDVLPKLENEQKKKCIYISLYGINSIEEINKLVFMNIILGSEKTKEMEDVIEPGVSLLARIIKPFIPVPDVIKDNRNIKNIKKIFIKKFKIKNIVFIFDDLERCSCSIEEVFGYLNNFVEQNQNKVILIANEKEIITHHQETEQSENIEDDKQKTCGNSYLLIKEKLVGITLHFHPNLKKVMESIVKNNEGIDSKLKNEILIDLNHIEERMKEHKNLRTFQIYLSKLNLLYQKIKSENYKNEKDIHKKVNKEILEACIKLKKGKEIGRAPGEFQFVSRYVEENFYNNDEVLKELKNFDEWITFEKRDPEGSMNKLKAFDFTKDKDVENAMELVIERLERNEESIYTKENFLDMLNLFIYYREIIGVGKEFVEKLETLIVNNFQIDKTDTLRYQYPDNPIKEKFQNSINRIYNHCQETKENKIQQQLTECLSKKNWSRELRNIVGFKFDAPESKRISFLDKINLQSLIERIEKSEAEQMIEFKDVLHWVYSEEQENSVEILKKFKEMMEEVKDRTEEKIKKYHLESIIQELANDIKSQEIFNYTGE